MRWIRARLLQHFLELGDKARLIEMTAEQAHADRRLGQVFGFPILKLKAGLLETPRIDRPRDASLFGDIDELAVRHDAALRMIPAKLSLEFDHSPGFERDD